MESKQAKQSNGHVQQYCIQLKTATRILIDSTGLVWMWNSAKTLSNLQMLKCQQCSEQQEEAISWLKIQTTNVQPTLDRRQSVQLLRTAWKSPPLLKIKNKNQQLEFGNT